jgi:hypothetical protein
VHALASSACGTRAWFRSTKRPKAFVGGVTHQCLETHADRFGVRPGAGRCPGLAEKLLVDVQRLLHPYHYAI